MVERKQQEVADAYGKLLRRIDDWFGRCMATAGEAIACRSGCCECCRGLFDITLLDAFFLKTGFDLLPETVRSEVLGRVHKRLAVMKEAWPDFAEPYLLNVRAEEEWEALMPDDDETPCPLLGNDGRCLVYEYRPMTCRLHGLPLVDLSGEVMHDEWCTLNFKGVDPLTRLDLRGEFDMLFREEVALFREFAAALLKKDFEELDTFIPTALLMDFRDFDWERWGRDTEIVLNEPV